MKYPKGFTENFVAWLIGRQGDGESDPNVKEEGTDANEHDNSDNVPCALRSQVDEDFQSLIGTREEWAVNNAALLQRVYKLLSMWKVKEVYGHDHESFKVDDRLLDLLYDCAKLYEKMAAYFPHIPFPPINHDIIFEVFFSCVEARQVENTHFFFS